MEKYPVYKASFPIRTTKELSQFLRENLEYWPPNFDDGDFTHVDISSVHEVYQTKRIFELGVEYGKWLAKKQG